MTREGQGFEQAQRSPKELKDRLSVLDEIIDAFGKDHPKSIDAMIERADLRENLARLEQAHERPQQEPRADEKREPVIPVEQKMALQKREDLNHVLAQEFSGLLTWSFSRPVMKPVLGLLRDPSNVTRFLNGQIGMDFFTQGIKNDLKAKEVLEGALDRLYTAATGESYFGDQELAA
ncbi:hypothetical protein HZA85_01320 [Candidatus Uhrbacteria bacterium]|nr:hypothetical protein [Candidatus Uhrbacteria bacterium]